MDVVVGTVRSVRSSLVPGPPVTPIDSIGIRIIWNESGLVEINGLERV